MSQKSRICLLSSLAIGLTLAMPSEVFAETEKITNLTEFYNYYGSDFTLGQQEIIEGIFDNIDPYLQPGGLGLQNAVNDGFIPFTKEWVDHGVHWFNPTFVDLTNMQADPLRPSGLNMSKDGELLGVFWAEELYDPPLVGAFQSLQQSGLLATLTPEELTQIYTQQTATETEVPTDFDAFSDIGLGWHKHKNVIIENLAQRDENGNLNPQEVDFRQSLTNENFINEVISSLVNPDSILSPLEVELPLEFDSTSGYPLNRGVSGGFHMLHMWVGLGNEAGLFNGINKSIEVSDMAINESETFEDGTDGHGHGMEGGDRHEDSHQSVPEPSFVGAMLALIALLVTNKIKKHSTAIN